MKSIQEFWWDPEVKFTLRIVEANQTCEWYGPGYHECVMIRKLVSTKYFN